METDADSCHPGRCWLTLLLLRLLAEESMHGYALMEALRERGYIPEGGIETGTLYTMLRRMERRGFLESSWDEAGSGRRRRIYRITNRGLEFLRSGLKALADRRPVIEELLDFYRRRLREVGGDGEGD